MKNRNDTLFFRLTSMMSPAPVQPEMPPGDYDRIFKSLFALLPDQAHPKTWANLLQNLQDDKERQIFSAYEWHSVKIIISHIKPPSKECRKRDVPPPGKNEYEIVADHFLNFVKKYNALQRDKKINAVLVKPLISEFKDMIKAGKNNYKLTKNFR